MVANTPNKEFSRKENIVGFPGASQRKKIKQKNKQINNNNK